MKLQWRSWKTWLASGALALVAAVSLLFAYFPHVLLATMSDRELQAHGLQPKDLMVDGVCIHYAEGGNLQGPTLLLVHGFRSSMAYWLAYLPYLNGKYHIVALDLPAHGASERAPGFKYDLASMGKWLARFMEEKGLASADVMGASMGGGVALALAAQHPELVGRLAVINPLAVNPPKESEVHAALADGQNLLLPYDSSSFVKMQQVVYGSKLPLNPVLAKLILNSLVRDREFFLVAFDQMVKGGGLERLLPDVKAPLLVVQSDDDRVVDPSSIEVMQLFLPHMQVVWIAGGAHTLRGEHRERAVDEMVRFFDRTQALAHEDKP